jgi:hypothetical protein
VDDHTRIGFTAMHPGEKTGSAITHLRAAIACYAKLGINIKRLLTNNDSAFRSKALVRTAASSVLPCATPGATAPRPTARPSCSSSRRSRNGPMPYPVSTLQIALLPCTTGPTTATGIVPIKESRHCDRLQFWPVKAD